MKKTIATFMLMLATALPSIAFATPEEDLAAAQKLYEERQPFSEDQTTESWANLKQSIELSEKAAAEATDEDLKYDAFIFTSSVYYFRGILREKKQDRLDDFTSALESAQKASQINDEYADAYYHYSISLARWAETKGVLESLKRKGELLDNLELATSKFSKEGDLGEALDGYGPYRTLGRVYFKLPGFAGGSRTKSLDYLKQAYDNAPEFALNIVYYVDTLYDGNSSEKAEACRIIDELLANDPATYNPDRTVETTQDFRTAQELRAKMKHCNP